MQERIHKLEKRLSGAKLAPEQVLRFFGNNFEFILCSNLFLYICENYLKLNINKILIFIYV